MIFELKQDCHYSRKRLQVATGDHMLAKVRKEQKLGGVERKHHTKKSEDAALPRSHSHLFPHPASQM